MKYSKEIQIGTALVLAVVLLYTGQRFFRDLPLFASAHSYTTITPDAAGILPGSAVRIHGVYVGSVTAVQIIEGAARVEFEIGKDILLPHGTTAVLGGFGFIADVRMDLVLGPSDTTMHTPGDLIPVSYDEGLFSTLEAAAPSVIEELEGLLKGSNDAVSAARVQLEDPTSNLRQAVQSIGASADALHGLLSRESEALGATIEDVEAMAEAVTALAQDSLAFTVGEINQLVARLRQNLVHLEETTIALNTFLTRMNSGQGTLGKLATDDSLYIEAAGAAAALRRILEEFETNPKRYLDELRLIDIF